ncbi:MAG: hypothetical protein JJLCMIEE_00553 [Acidimicrobiales bacterium]|nr:MAG: hypothetical protein EDR02_04345 [Actinomycetota bacterium]MBV6507504.1 hypothetical protein [Acidimicrobiales bacterium]
MRDGRQRSRDKRRAKVEQRRSSARYAVVYDIDGPRIRLGVLWFLLLAGALIAGVLVLGALYGAVAGLAGWQTAKVWAKEGRPSEPWVAAAAAGLIGFAGSIGTATTGMVIVAAVVAALVAALIRHRVLLTRLLSAGFTVRSGVFVGLAAASPTIVMRIDIGACVMLVLLVSMYEVGDFLVGSGSANPVEGPLAGIVGVMVVTFAMSVIQPPPFDEQAVWLFGGMTAALCPVGQLAGSAILPRSNSDARALRRLDSLLVAGPLFAVALWNYTG